MLSSQIILFWRQSNIVLELYRVFWKNFNDNIQHLYQNEVLVILLILTFQMFGGGFGGFGGFGGMQGQDDEKPTAKKQVDTIEYYNMLGVDKKATTDQIRKAFRKKALKEHPDKGGDPDKFKVLTHAYDVLTNPEKRQLYDDYGEQGVQNGGPPGGSGFDIFDMFRRKESSGPRKGKPRLITLEVTMEQIFNGTMKKVKVERTRNCQTCDGKGGKNVQKCTKCKGRGAVQKLVQLGPGMYTQSSQKCGNCKGKGQTMKQQDRCKDCKGEKVKKVERQLEVAIEAGCPNKHDYIFTGENDEYPGIIAGDIYVRVQIKKHKTFIRKGADLAIIKNITLLEALSGVTMQIEHLDGKMYTLATAPGEILSNNDFKVIKKLGMPFYKDPMSYGNLIVEFIIEFPKKNFFNKEKIDKLIQILSKQKPKAETPKRNPKTNKVLEEYSDADLNPSASGGQEEEDQRHIPGAGGRQQVQCQQQ